ncbi:M81 family metallopeptidase [Salinibacterium sp. M195]|uniref:M81 family metallopeptidase n=1 Tax=Salinibacterium sp. M195 TaxID=2583374 RepID=UPI001C62965F|nr:M81 family metallopeptidase [Salinibacterium sp. M195]QYH35268.1 M81 family metallopeptidase [Salinibacterium sp. M195]
MTSRFRVGVLGVYHETNTFSPLRTGKKEFAHRWYVGDEVLDAFEDTRTVCGGFLDGAREKQLDIVPLFATFATPSGTVEATVFDSILTAVATALDGAEQLDGILLELHGDFVADGVGDAEEEIVAVIRSRAAGVPIAAVLDLHTNFAHQRLHDVEILIGYKTNPHVDTYDRGRDAASALAGILSGDPVPYRAHRGLSIVAPPAAQSTQDSPLRELIDTARSLQEKESLLDVTVLAGYAYSDTRHTGMGFLASGPPDRAEAAERVVEALHQLAEASATKFAADYPDATAAVERAATLRAEGRPVTIADTGDNINGGASGDTTWLAHAAQLHGQGRFLTTIFDPAALAMLRNCEGDPLRELGGFASDRSGQPLQGSPEVLNVTDGKFVNTGPMSTGTVVDMKGAAWVRMGALDIVIQGSPVQPNDPGMFTALGIDPADYDALLLKGAAALRAGWARYSDHFIFAGTPGETDSLLGRLHYQQATVSTDHLAHDGSA